MTPVLSPSSASQFVSGFYCFSIGSSCFFGIVICGGRYQEHNYAELDGPQPVWSANRDRPVKVNATLKLTRDGDLILEDADGDMVWSTKTGGKSVAGLRFTEFGSLVLFDSNNATVWQSFDHPTDSLLIGQKLVSNSGQKLIARTSSSDFSRGLFSLSVRNSSLFGYIEANPPVVYYISTLEANPNSIYSEKEYVVFENGSFNGQTFALGSTAQFMRLEPDGHLKVYEWVQSEWKTIVDLLTPSFGDCGYPMVCGKYGIYSSNGRCGCFAGSRNEVQQISYKQTNLGCSLVTPISCDHSQYTRLVELKNISYFTLNWRHLYNELDEKTGLEDCKNACLRNCSCKAALFADTSYNYPATRGCMLLSEVFSLIDDERGSDNTTIFLKVPNAPSKRHFPLQPIDFPRKKSSSGRIILGSKPEEPDEFSIDKVPGMPTRFSYNDLKTATNDFRNKLGEGGFGSVFQGTLSDGTEVVVKHLASLSQIKKSFLAEVQTIGSIHHVNLVRLIGFCAENSNRLLVYEYMSNGSLDRWIFKRHQELTLGWESRRKIIVDIAKGLAYLHKECRQKIYHLDVKPQNILLDENFVAKVSDFGLAKLIDKDQSRIVATLGGTPGYMAPEWLSLIITEKVDVYSFGVVVLEILCGRKNLDRSQPEEEMHLLGLFERKGEEGQLLDMVDTYNADMQLHGPEVVEMMKLAVWCLQSDYQSRPSMTVVIQVLEGFVSVQDNLAFNFINAPARRKIATTGDDRDAAHDGTTLFASDLSGPRNASGLDVQTEVEDSKKSCLSNCSCKAVFFSYAVALNSKPGCLLLFEAFSLGIDPYNISTKFLKMQKPLISTRRKSRYSEEDDEFSLVQVTILLVCLGKEDLGRSFWGNQSTTSEVPGLFAQGILLATDFGKTGPVFGRKQGDRPTEPQNEGLEFQTEEHPVPKVSENSQGNGSSSLVDVQSLSKQLAQVLSNPEDEAAQELITLMRRVVTPPSTIDVDANGVVHEQVRCGDMPKQTSQQVYSNPAFESSMYIHGWPLMESNTLRSTIRPTSFYQSIPSAYEVGNSSGYGQNSYFNNAQSVQHGFAGTHVITNDLIQKGLLQYAKGDKDPMGIESNPFPKVEVNMVTASLAKRLGSTVEKRKQGDEDQMETDEESAKSHFSRFPNDYLCIRCGREVKYGEAIIAEKEQRCAFCKSGIGFNTMGGNYLQIYVGVKLIYEGIDPGLFHRIESEHCYGPDDGPFLFRGNPVVPARPRVPSCQDLEVAGYQFPSRGGYSSNRGAGFRRGIGP
ncbi:hypothetical protein RHSIM_Rhsim06G0123400 [Rhododendron simsii]|uniref:non-specific serine/threonine protein kinase n=1 Tax=Rhododendron simsii TaxID=118357 RepID=A0A834GRJ5_RHOSS|nr:hypothetical protein RHSIM_Rhsim06G0123400 [Rhododendron simsii]